MVCSNILLWTVSFVQNEVLTCVGWDYSSRHMDGTRLAVFLFVKSPDAQALLISAQPLRCFWSGIFDLLQFLTNPQKSQVRSQVPNGQIVLALQEQMLRILQKPPPVGIMVWSNPCQISWDDLHCNKNVCYAALTPLLCILKFCHKYCPLAMSTNRQNTDLPLPWAYISAQENSDARWLNVNGFLNHTVCPLTLSNMGGKSGGLISFW